MQVQYGVGEYAVLDIGIVLLFSAVTMVGIHIFRRNNPFANTAILLPLASICSVVGVFGFILPSVAMAQSHYHTQHATRALTAEAQRLGVTVTNVDVSDKGRLDGSVGSAVISNGTCTFQVYWKRGSNQPTAFTWTSNADAVIITPESLEESLQRNCIVSG